MHPCLHGCGWVGPWCFLVLMTSMCYRCECLRVFFVRILPPPPPPPRQRAHLMEWPPAPCELLRAPIRTALNHRRATRLRDANRSSCYDLPSGISFVCVRSFTRQRFCCALAVCRPSLSVGWFATLIMATGSIVTRWEMRMMCCVAMNIDVTPSAKPSVGPNEALVCH